MAGLLDFQSKLPGLLQDDGFRLGLSLLAAAGPSATPMSAGQRIQQGLMAFQQQKDSEADRALKTRLLEAQIGEHQAKANQQANVQALLGRFTQPGGAGVAAMSPGDMLALKAAGVDPTEIVKYAGQGNKFDPGSVYQNPVTGAMMHVPKVADGVQLNPDGSAALLPGYASATGQIEGAKNWAAVAPTLATEAGKAGIAAKNDLMQVYNPATQAMQFLPRSQVLGAAQPGYANEGQMRATAQGDMGGKLADLDKEIAATQKSLKNPNLDAGSRKMLEQHIATLQGQRATYYQQGPMQAGPSASDEATAAAAKAGAVKQAEADVVPSQQKTNALAKFDQVLGTIGTVLNHPGLPMATGLSGKLDPRNYVPGTQAADFAAKADQLQGQVFMSAYEGLRGGGAITEVEGKKAENAIASLSRNQSPEQYRKSLGELRDVIVGARARLTGAKAPEPAAPARQPVKTGLYQGRKVVQYSDGTVSYAD